MTPPHPKDEDDPPTLTHDEVAWVRAQRKQTAHEEWLRGQIKVVWPWVIAVITAVVAAVSWIKDHVRL